MQCLAGLRCAGKGMFRAGKTFCDKVLRFKKIGQG